MFDSCDEVSDVRVIE